MRLFESKTTGGLTLIGRTFNCASRNIVKTRLAGIGLLTAAGAYMEEGIRIVNPELGNKYFPILLFSDYDLPALALTLVILAAVTTELSISSVRSVNKTTADKAIAEKAATDQLDAELKAAEAAANAGAKKGPKKPTDAVKPDFQADLNLDTEPESESERQTGIYGGERKSYSAGASEHHIDPARAEDKTVEVGSEELGTVNLTLKRQEGQAVGSAEVKPRQVDEEEEIRTILADMSEKTRLIEGNPYQHIIKATQTLPKGQLKNLLTRSLDRLILGSADDAQKAKAALIDLLEEIPEGEINDELHVAAKLQALDL